jgi:divinyl protochlorophyllide a 8-vinyl-reductase
MRVLEAAGTANARSVRVCDDPVGAVGVIGPNAITQVAAALGAARARPIFEVAGLAHYLLTPPASMVPQRDVRALHAALRAMLGESEARRVARDAGARTAVYLLANRIPRAAQRVFRLMPAWLAARMLLATIRRHSWTFCGTAEFQAAGTAPVRLSIKGCVLCRGAQSAVPVCDFYAACFAGLFRALVHPAARATEVACTATGAETCAFEVAW